MHNESLKVALYGLASQLPLVLVYVACVVVLAVRWRQAGEGAVWAASGLGLAILSTLAWPLIQSLAIAWASQNARTIPEVLNGVVFLFSCLRAVSYGLIFVGVLAGRTTGSTPPLPPDAYR